MTAAAAIKCSEFRRLTSLTARQIQWWVDTGLLAPRRDRNGTRLFAAEDVVTARLFDAMRKCGYSLRRIRGLPLLPVKGAYGVIRLGGVVWCEDAREVLTAGLETPGPCFVVSVADLTKGLDRWMPQN